MHHVSLGTYTVLGSRNGDRLEADQCSIRDDFGETRFSKSAREEALFDSCGWILRVEKVGETEDSSAYSPGEPRDVLFCGTMGLLAIS